MQSYKDLEIYLIAKELVVKAHRMTYKKTSCIMNRASCIMKNDGITLIELIIAVSIVGILAAAFAFEFQGWMGTYKVESQIKEMYVDLLNARTRAMQKNRLNFVDLPVTQPKRYTIYEDTNTAPDGNGTLETGSDTQMLQKNINYTIVPALALGARQFNFNKNGIISHNGSIRLTSTATSDYDCIVLFTTRINLGKWEECDASNPGNECCAR